MSVDFPDPDGPMTAMNSAASTVSDVGQSALTSTSPKLYVLLMPCASIRLISEHSRGRCNALRNLDKGLHDHFLTLFDIAGNKLAVVAVADAHRDRYSLGRVVFEYPDSRAFLLLSGYPVFFRGAGALLTMLTSFSGNLGT